LNLKSYFAEGISSFPVLLKYILSELGSPGKSGSFFYFSRDYKYIIKTIHHSAKVSEDPRCVVFEFKVVFCGGNQLVSGSATVSHTSKYILSELGSPGKSGSFFYFSRDYKYIIKTIHLSAVCHLDSVQSVEL
jgi:hypothetical protein